MSRGRGRRPPNFAPDSQQQQTVAATNLEPFFTPKAPQKSLIPAAWCDICRVDCNSLEILEQHKNGKRHKRTVQRVQEIQAQQKVSAYATNILIPSSSGEILKDIASSAQVPVVVEESIESFVALENNQMPEGQAVPVSVSQDETLPMDGPSKKRRMPPGYDRNDRWRGSRQKMTRIGRGGGKHFKGFDRTTHNRPKERPRDRPRVCTVCQIMCDTMAVFECHLSGKKHISRIKRFEGHGSVYGPIDVFIPPNQPTTYPIKGPEPLFYGLQNLETMQQGTIESEVKQSSGHPEEVGMETDGIGEERVVEMPDPDGRSSINEPDEEDNTNNSASDDTDLIESTVLPIVVSGLDANSEGAIPSSE